MIHTRTFRVLFVGSLIAVIPVTVFVFVSLIWPFYREHRYASPEFVHFAFWAIPTIAIVPFIALVAWAVRRRSVFVGGILGCFLSQFVQELQE